MGMPPFFFLFVTNTPKLAAETTVFSVAKFGIFAKSP